MEILIEPNREAANELAANHLASFLADSSVRNFMPAAGNTPLDLYGRIAAMNLDHSALQMFLLDEYLGVPLEEPRTCANLLRGAIARPWRIPLERFFSLSTIESDAPAEVREHESRIAGSGGLDLVVLGLGQNGHLGFNEPGSGEDSAGRVVHLDPISIEANRAWFDERYAPAKGVTVGLQTILAARNIMILAYGPRKASAVEAMVRGARGPHCPASFLQTHSDAALYLDRAAAAGLLQ